jgi:hypothetical protein
MTGVQKPSWLLRASWTFSSSDPLNSRRKTHAPYETTMNCDRNKTREFPRSLSASGERTEIQRKVLQGCAQTSAQLVNPTSIAPSDSRVKGVLTNLLILTILTNH